jgi:hypothetical protein
MNSGLRKRQSRVVKRRILSIVLTFTVAASIGAQPAQRRTTNIAALAAYSGFYHLRPVIVAGNLVQRDDGELRLTGDTGSIRVVFKGSIPDGMAEVRGEFWDLGRLNADDPRLAGYDLRATFQIDPEAPWPSPGEVTALVASAAAPITPPAAPSIRSVVLLPDRYVEQRLTLIGQFAGRNLLGDLPDAPARSQFDFVLRSADAAIWVTNMRPRGKDFELALDSRLDTGRWLEVTGTLRQGRGLQWLDAEANTLSIAKPPSETADDEPIRVPAAPPPEVSFSVPIEDETGVLLTSNVRIQFTRDINASTLRNRIRVTYLPPANATADQSAPTSIEFTTQYAAATRVLEIRFPKPLERFRTVRVELIDGILGADQQPLKPWTLTFTCGG